VKLDFIYHEVMEGGFPFGAEGSPDWHRPMVRCECAETSFDEVLRRMKDEGLSLEEVTERTGCGRLCSACLPDLRKHLGKTG
jgi:NAD(P)H-nitrite reductase large subunit